MGWWPKITSDSGAFNRQGRNPCFIRKTQMASKKYRIESIKEIGLPARKSLRRRVRAKLLRLEDGRELDVSMAAMGRVGEIVSLEDEHVYLGLWQPYSS
jgi:hypothetical protein